MCPIAMVPTPNVGGIVDHHVSHCDEVRAIVLDLHPTIFTEVIADNVSHCDDAYIKYGRYLHGC